MSDKHVVPCEIEYAMWKGITPRKLETAYKEQRVFQLAKEAGVKVTEVYLLKKRWGINEPVS